MTEQYLQREINLGGRIYSRVIRSLSDLPAPDDDGVISLTDPGCALLAGSITLPDGVRIALGGQTVLQGCDPDVSGIFGNVDAPLISGISPDSGIVITDLFVRNSSTADNGYNIEVTNGFVGDPDVRPCRVDRCSIGGGRGVFVHDVSGATITVLSRCESESIRLSGLTNGVQIIQSLMTVPSSASPTHIVFDGGNHAAIRLSDLALIMDNGNVGIQMLNLPSISLFRLGDSDFVPQGPGTPYSGEISGGSGPVDFGPDSQNDVLFFDNFGVEESSFSGGMVINSNSIATDVTTLGFGTFVPVGWNAAPAHAPFLAENNNSRFEVTNPGGPAEIQRLRYIGPEPISVRVTADVTLETTVIFQKRVAVRIDYFPGGLPSPVAAPLPPVTGSPQTEFAGLLADGFSGGGSVGFIQATARLTLNPGDELAVEVTDQGTLNPAVNLICVACNLSFDQV